MAELIYPRNEKNLLRGIIAVSVAVPLVVAFLLFSPFKVNLPVELVQHFPTVIATLNSFTAVLLVAALVAVRKRNIKLHRQLMLGAMALGALFLVFYVLYHASVPSTKFGDVNGDYVRDAAEQAAVGYSLYVYTFVLLTHIVFAAVVLPFVLMAAYFALKDNIRLHQKVVKWAYPMWLFVSISGVMVYFMIRPYYQF
ncbi:hypothetical protein D770_27005 [Flammeovirgaceae bacterium 311]|nr:hypothetical protein D770_27005 [Flammeovirgaceae bacterium 311]